MLFGDKMSVHWELHFSLISLDNHIETEKHYAFWQAVCKASRQAAELGSDAVSMNGPLNVDGNHDNDGIEKRVIIEENIQQRFLEKES